LRGTWADPFGRHEDRKIERRLIGEYEAAIDLVISVLTPETVDLASALLNLPSEIRGYGPVKAKNYQETKVKWQALVDQLTGKTDAMRHAA
jgi:indolepyruvate ferredoxin oxidoreductase